MADRSDPDRSDSHAVTPEPAEWRYFAMLELREAFAWADEGGIAVHDSGMTFRGLRAAHLFAEDERTLVAAAGHVGVEARWIQRESRRVHFDLFGPPLRRALRLCENAPDGEPEGPVSDA